MRAPSLSSVCCGRCWHPGLNGELTTCGDGDDMGSTEGQKSWGGHSTQRERWVGRTFSRDPVKELDLGNSFMLIFPKQFVSACKAQSASLHVESNLGRQSTACYGPMRHHSMPSAPPLSPLIAPPCPGSTSSVIMPPTHFPPQLPGPLCFLTELCYPVHARHCVPNGLSQTQTPPHLSLLCLPTLWVPNPPPVSLPPCLPCAVLSHHLERCHPLSSGVPQKRGTVSFVADVMECLQEHQGPPA